jgi:hypothetical protein
MGNSLLPGRSGIVTARAAGRQVIKGRDEIPVSSADQFDSSTADPGTTAN